MNQNLTLFELNCAKMPVTLADYIYAAIQREYIKILTLEADLLAGDDVKAVHQMRVSLRRLRSQLQVFGSMLDLPNSLKDQQIRKIAKVLGKVRDLDVLHDTCKYHQLNLPDIEQPYLVKIIAKIIKYRHNQISKVKLMLNGRDYQHLKLGINNWLNNPQYSPTAQVKVASILPDILLSKIGQLFLNASWWVNLDENIDPELAVSQLILTDGRMFHDFRKQVKATRYLMEIFSDRYPPQYHNYLKDLKQVHQIFGNIQDNLVLNDFICKVVGKQALTKLPVLYDRIARTNHLNWDNWKVIQDRYRQSITKQEFQLLLIKDIIKVLEN